MVGARPVSRRGKVLISASGCKLHRTMLLPHYVYPIAGTLWYIVILKGAQHFYYDSATKRSVWQLGETGISDLAVKVNFDDLAVLFAKSNGVDFGSETRQFKPLARPNPVPDCKQLLTPGSKNQHLETPASPDYESLDHPQVESHGEVSLGETEAESDDLEPKLGSKQPPGPLVASASGLGLSLGYSSSEEDPSDAQQDDGSEDDISTHDINSGLDLGLDDEDEAVAPGQHKTPHNKQFEQFEQFEAILDQYENEISTMDPWMLVEEDLLPKFSLHPEYYNLSEPSMRERAFNNWVTKRNACHEASEASHEKESQNSFPTDTLRFFRFLQERKSDVRKMYYVDFEKKYKEELDSYQSAGCDLESLYRQLRVTLNDFSDFERAQKAKRQSSTQVGKKNFKLAHVEEFLAEHNLAKYASNHDIGKLENNMDSFDHWVQICNLFSLPKNLVHDPRNFIIGDEKRVIAYLSGLRKGATGETSEM